MLENGCNAARAEMKHVTSRMLFAHWDAVRGDRLMPERADIRPGSLRHVLSDTFILGYSQHDHAAFRLAGSRICSLFGRDLKGVDLRDLWRREERSDTDQLVREATTEAIGFVMGLTGFNENESLMPLELVLLPLRHRIRTQGRLLGSLAPLSLPSWMGLVPLRSVETTSVRVIQPERETESVSFGVPLEPGTPPRRRGLFVVHEGDRS